MIVKEFLDFERGRDPKIRMGLGIINQITEDLFAEMVICSGGEDYEKASEMEDPERYKMVKAIQQVIEPYLEYGNYFDWKEEEEMKSYIQEKRKGRFVYNGTPWNDGTHVIFSSVEIPQLKSIA